jgi:hypothetical protein
MDMQALKAAIDISVDILLRWFTTILSIDDM